MNTREETPQTPILTSIYRIAGLLCLVLSAIALFNTINSPLLDSSQKLISASVSGGSMFMVALLFFGMAQVVMLISKIENDTRSEETEYKITKLLTEIARNTAKES